MMGMGGGGSFGGMNPMSSGRFNVPFTGGNMGMDMHRIPIVGNMFQNPYDQFKQQQMQNAAGAYSMYRPEAMQGWMNAQNQQSAQLQPMNNALAAMYGTGATQGFEAQNPFGPTAFTRGAAVGTDPSMPQPPGAAPPPGQPGGHPAAGGTQGAGETALDMLRQVPGFIGGGFGQGADGARQGFSSFGSGLYNTVSGNGSWGGLGEGRWF